MEFINMICIFTFNSSINMGIYSGFYLNFIAKYTFFLSLQIPIFTLKGSFSMTRLQQIELWNFRERSKLPGICTF